MKILIRSDSSSTIGLGHIMRDLVLAEEFQDDVTFACQILEGNMIERIPYDVSILQSNDVNELISLIQHLHVTLLVIDHYGIDASFEQHVKEVTGVKILSFDDTYEKHHCDIVLNHNVCAHTSRYEHLVPKGCVLRCGKPLIRKEFHAEKAIQREKIYDVLIAMGGTDAYNLSQKIAQALPKDKRIAILTTTANAHLKELQSFVAEKSHIALHVNSNEVAKLLHQSKLVVVTPSVMVHEVLFMEVPLIAIKVASNQDDMYMYLKKNGYATMEKFEPNLFQESLKLCNPL